MDGILVTNCDDWEALYIDGVLYTQDHQIKPSTYRKVKGKLFRQEIDSEYTYEVGYLPNNYEDIPKDAFMDEPEEMED